MVYFEKSQPPPKCLEAEKQKKDGNYKCGDVLERLQADFKNKCYLCERKAPVSINVEHLVSHQGNKDLKFDWNNLFWSCYHCNNIKSIKYNDILNCTIISDDVENALYFHMPPYPKEMVEISVVKPSQKANLLKELLLKIYNGSSELKTLEAENIKDALLKEMIKFQISLQNYYNSENDQEADEYFLIQIKRHLSRSSNFTAFKRWIIKKNPNLKHDLEKYFD